MSDVDLALPEDFRDLLVELAEAGADFVIVGGYAVAMHGHPRATKDIDIFLRPSPENSRKVFQALVAFGAPLQQFGVTEREFAIPGGVLQLGVAPCRIDLLTQATGITFEEAFADCRMLTVGGREVRVIGLAALLKNKRATARPQDLADVAALDSGE